MDEGMEKLGEKELLGLFAECPALFLEEALTGHVEAQEGNPYRERLKFFLETARHKYQGDRVKWLEYVLSLVVSCPPLLKQEGEFGWVRDELFTILMKRYLGQKAGIFRPNKETTGSTKLFAQDFWSAWMGVSKKLNSKGRPSESGRHFAIANEVYRLMAEQGMPKDAAVVKLGDRLKKEGKSKGHYQRDQIYDSLRFVKESGLWKKPGENTTRLTYKTKVKGTKGVRKTNFTLEGEIPNEGSPEPPPDQSSENISEEGKRKQKGKSNRPPRN